MGDTCAPVADSCQCMAKKNHNIVNELSSSQNKLLNFKKDDLREPTNLFLCMRTQREDSHLLTKKIKGLYSNGPQVPAMTKLNSRI